MSILGASNTGLAPVRTVLDNGAPQQIAIFERRTEQPLLVSLLIDNSGSTAKDLKYEIESVNRFVRVQLLDRLKAVCSSNQRQTNVYDEV